MYSGGVLDFKILKFYLGPKCLITTIIQKYRYPSWYDSVAEKIIRKQES